MSFLPPCDNRTDDMSDQESQELRDLNAQEMDKLVQLQDITGIEDVAICRALLESKNWDLEATAREQLGIPVRQSREDENNSADRSQGPVSAPPQAPGIRIVRARPNSSRGLLAGAFEWGVYLLTLPVTLPFRIVQSLYELLAHVLGFPAASGGRRVQHLGGPASPAEDVRTFREDFCSRYCNDASPSPSLSSSSSSSSSSSASSTSSVIFPPFHRGSYAQALDEAKRQLKFLLVYLHSAEHQDTERFCRETLTSRALVEFLEQSQMLLWGCAVESGEGARVSQAMRESTYPFLVVIVLRQNRMMVVGRVEGFLPAQALVQRLEEIVRDNEAFIVEARHDREQRERNQSIREQQDAAFRETLRQDQEKERKKREAEEAKRRQEEEEKRLQREAQERKDRIKQMKVDLVIEIPEEPEEKHPEAVKLLIKLPGGQRLERRFIKSQSLKCLYYFVFCHPDSPDEFDITTNFPRKVLQCRPEDHPPTFEEAGLGQATTLFVHDLEA